MEIVNRNGYFEDNCYIYIDLQELLMIHLDSGHKKIIMVISCSGLGCLVGYLLLMWAFGELDSWEDALTFLGLGLIIVVILSVLYVLRAKINVLGSKIPKKGE